MSSDDQDAEHTQDAKEPQGDSQKALWRVLRHRRGLAGGIVGGLTGVLLGAGVVAWQADTFPLGPDPKVCWGSLSADELPTRTEHSGWDRGLDASVEELTPRWTTFDGITAHCRISDGSQKVDIRVGEPHSSPGRPRADGTSWSREFLTSNMSWIGGDTPGMVAPQRAWIAIPETCYRTGDNEPPVIVDISLSALDGEGTDYSPPQDDDHRLWLAQTVTRLANGVMADRGCADRIALPDTVPERPSHHPVDDAGSLCGIDGLTATEDAAPVLATQRISAGEGPVRVCALGVGGTKSLSTMTIEAPALAAILRGAASSLGKRVYGDNFYGGMSASLSVLHVTCGTGEVALVMRGSWNHPDPALMEDMFPRYVTAEADRIGCGPLSLDDTD
ncbi:hypothetical protein ACFVUW_10960 [Streptomyces xiamenensis]|uniref:hypothetical protein n=1 Tax=Streptomyces xiamenensis TaxID=408015 RepID=UPI0036E67E08